MTETNTKKSLGSKAGYVQYTSPNFPNTSRILNVLIQMKRNPALLYSASELLDRAADLSSEFALLVHDSEPRWRAFREKIEKLRTVPAKQEAKPEPLKSSE